jgi:flotillin
VLLALLTVLTLLSKCYIRCPSNRVLVVYGRTPGGDQAAHVIHGGARFVVPLVQDYAWLSLEPMEIEIPLRGALSSEGIRVNLPSEFRVVIGTTPELLQNAAIRLLGLSEGEIKVQARDIIFGQLRQVISSMPVDRIYRDGDKFLENLQRSLEPELSKIGLVLINVNILDVTDDSGCIEAIDQSATAAALLERVLTAFDGSAQRLVAYLLEEGKLNEEDCREIRRLLEDSGSSPEKNVNP